MEQWKDFQQLTYQLDSRKETLEFMTHALNHVKIYNDVMISRLVRTHDLTEQQLGKMEKSVRTASNEIEAMQATMDRCDVTSEQLLRMSADPSYMDEVLTEYRRKSCWTQQKGAQMRQKFQGVIEAWWKSQEKILIGALGTSNEAEIKQLFRDHQPKYILHSLRDKAIDPKQFWEHESSTYQRKLEKAADVFFARYESRSSRLYRSLKSTVATYWLPFQKQVSSVLSTVTEQVTKRYYVSLTVLAVGTLILAASAASMYSLDVGNVATLVSSSYVAAIGKMQTYCFVFHDIEAYIGMSYVVKIVCGGGKNAFINAISDVGDKQYPYSSTFLRETIDYVSSVEVVKALRQLLITRFSLSVKQSDKVTNILLQNDNGGDEDLWLMKVLYQVMYWMNFCLSFGCASGMNDLQTAANYVDKIDQAKTYFGSIGKNMLNATTSTIGDASKIIPPSMSKFTKAYIEESMLLLKAT